jgi:hypothetical protein
MGFLQKVEIAAAIVESTKEHKSYRAKVEAKYAIMETIKKVMTKVLKVALPALIAFSATTGFAKIKDPEGLGKKFQEIATDTIGHTEVKTHTLSEEDDGQIVVYTIKIKGDDTNEWGTASIKYTEGKGAKIATINSSGGVGSLAQSIVDTLNTIDAHGKKMAKETKSKPAATKDTKFAKKTNPAKTGQQYAWDK